jgi:hypothetical protein
MTASTKDLQRKALMHDLRDMLMNSADDRIRMRAYDAQLIALRLIEYDPNAWRIEKISFRENRRVELTYVTFGRGKDKLTFVLNDFQFERERVPADWKEDA